MSLAETIFKYNTTPEVAALRDFYSRKSFMEILSKSRNENSHSSFLGWLFGTDEIHSSEQPLMRLLDQLAIKANGSGQMSSELKGKILSRKISLFDIKSDTEKLIQDISLVKSKDRIDLYITANVKGLSGVGNLRIILENKIFSSEGNEKMNDANRNNIYNSKSQTERYAYACTEKSKDPGETLFVYLTPIGAESPISDKFIHITYQDLLDNVLVPLSMDTILDERSRVFIADYIRGLSVPAVKDDDDAYTILAVSQSEKAKLKNFWDRFKDVISGCAPHNRSNLTDEEKALAADFWEKNRPLFYAIFKATESELNEDDKKVFSTTVTRNHDKYALIDSGGNRYEILSKRGLVLTGVEELIRLKGYEKCRDEINRMKHPQTVIFSSEEFQKARDNKKLTEDQYNNRYSQIMDGQYYVNNQWGIGNIQDAIDVLSKYFTIQSIE